MDLSYKVKLIDEVSNRILSLCISGQLDKDILESELDYLVNKVILLQDYDQDRYAKYNEYRGEN